MPRISVAITTLILAASVAACGGSSGPTSADAPGAADTPVVIGEDTATTPVTLVEHAGGVSAVAISAAGQPVVERSVDRAVGSAGGTTAVRQYPDGDATVVQSVDVRTGAIRWAERAPAGWHVGIVAADGSLAALMPDEQPGAGTLIRVVGGNGLNRRVHLKGQFTPEAFAQDGSSMVAIEYLPAGNPTHYTIRSVALPSGRVSSVPDRDHPDRQPMDGYARRHLSTSDGSRLYTFYVSESGIDGHGHTPGDEALTYHAFVHVLDLREGWAYCVELADPFGTQGLDGASIALSPDESMLYAVDRLAGVVAEVDTEVLGITRTGVLPDAPESVLTSMSQGSLRVSTAVDDTTVRAATNGELLTIDRGSLAVTDTWNMDEPINSLRAIGAAGEFLAAIGSRVTVLDIKARRIVGRVEVSATAGDISVQPALNELDTGVYKCAC